MRLQPVQRFFGYFFIIMVLLQTGLSWATPPDNYQDAKRLARQIWRENRKTFYCDCRYDNHQVVQYHTCDFHPRKKRRQERIEWEHVVPVSWYGRQLPCWKRGYCQDKKNRVVNARACCEKTSPAFNAMVSDLHNLVPCEREVNRARSNFPFVNLSETPHSTMIPFQGCHFMIDEQDRVVVPSDEKKGWIARIHLYMIGKYRISVPQAHIERYQSWDKAFPPSDQERAWLSQVEAVMKEE